MTGWAPWRTRGGGAVLRFERLLAHPPEKVFRAISVPDELRHWFPATVERRAASAAHRSASRSTTATRTRRAARSSRSTRRGSCASLGRRRAGLGDRARGRGLPARVHARARARRHVRRAAGHRAQRGRLGRVPRLARGPARRRAASPQPAWFPLFEGYAERFGLGEARVTAAGVALRARRRPDSRRRSGRCSTGGARRVLGEPAPRRFAPTPPGRGRSVAPRRALAYAAAARATVRWSLEPRMPGTLVVAERPRPRDERPRARGVARAPGLLVADARRVERCWPRGAGRGARGPLRARSHRRVGRSLLRRRAGDPVVAHRARRPRRRRLEALAEDAVGDLEHGVGDPVAVLGGRARPAPSRRRARSSRPAGRPRAATPRARRPRRARAGRPRAAARRTSGGRSCSRSARSRRRAACRRGRRARAAGAGRA